MSFYNAHNTSILNSATSRNPWLMLYVYIVLSQFNNITQNAIYAIITYDLPTIKFQRSSNLWWDRPSRRDQNYSDTYACVILFNYMNMGFIIMPICFTLYCIYVQCELYPVVCVVISAMYLYITYLCHHIGKNVGEYLVAPRLSDEDQLLATLECELSQMLFDLYETCSGNIHKVSVDWEIKLGSLEHKINDIKFKKIKEKYKNTEYKYVGIVDDKHFGFITRESGIDWMLRVQHEKYTQPLPHWSNNPWCNGNLYNIDVAEPTY